MRGAVRLAGQRRRATEEEIGRAGITARPPAGVVGQLEQRAALRVGNGGIDARVVDVRIGVADPGRQRAPVRPDRTRCRRPLAGAGALCSGGFLGSCFLGSGGFLVAASAAPAAKRRQVGNAEPINEPENGAAADPVPQLARNLPCAGAFRPARRRILDALLRPRRLGGGAASPPQDDRPLHPDLLGLLPQTGLVLSTYFRHL